MFLKFYHFITLIKMYFNCLPKDIQEELVDTLEDYKDMCIISKFERSKKKNEV